MSDIYLPGCRLLGRRAAICLITVSKVAEAAGEAVFKVVEAVIEVVQAISEGAEAVTIVFQA